MKWVFAVIALLVSPSSWACSCSWLTVEEQLQRSDAVFQGQVIDRKPPPAPLEDSEYEALSPEAKKAYNAQQSRGWEIVFKVATIWKGVTTPEVSLFVGTGLCCDCSLGSGRFILETSHLINAYQRTNGGLSTNQCSAIPGDTSAASVSAVLGEPTTQPVESQPSSPDEPPVGEEPAPEVSE